MTNQDLERVALDDIFDRLTLSREAKLLQIRCVRTMAATQLFEPGADEIRPSVKTPVNGLYLAGDWIGNGLPATMESAARSGEEVADLILSEN